MGSRCILTFAVRRGAGLVASMAASAALAAGCLDDLPEPLVCPPEPAYAGESCAPLLEEVGLGCLLPEQMACLTGPRESCTCIADECPTPEQACYPEGDCPAEVKEAARGEAECLHLSPKEIGGGLPSEFQCLCGCAGCLAVCDGRGPVLGVANDGSFEVAPVVIDVAARMPEEGRLGVFMRARGLSGAALAVLKGNEPDYEIAMVYYISSPIGTEYTSQVFYDDPFLGTKEYEWTTAADRPTLIALFAGEGSPGAPQLTLMEIDCVIPFVPVQQGSQ